MQILSSRRFRHSTVACGALAAALLASPAFAQSTPPAASADVPTGDDAEIVVTAQKRTQTLLQVPSAVLAISGDRLRETGTTNFLQLTQQTPGVIASNQLVGGRTIQTFTIRGIGYDDFRPNGSPSAAVHFDGVYQGSSALIGGQMFDVARVEILKGPQGTLYGRNTTAGAVNVISQKPGTTSEGYAMLDYARFGSVRAEGAVNVPVNDAVAVRVSGVYDRTDGFLTNVGSGRFGGSTPNPAIPANGNPARDDQAAGSTFDAGRALVSVQAGTGTELLLNLHGFDETGGQAQAERTLATGTYAANAPYTFDANVVPRLSKQNYGGSLTLTQDVGDTVEMTVVGGYEHLKQRYTWNDGQPIRQFDIAYRDRLEQGSVEARLQNRVGTTFDWVVGGAYFRDDTTLDSTLDSSDVFRTVFDAAYRQKRSSWAVFGDGTYHLNDALKLGIGLRYTRENSRFLGATVDANPYGTSVAGAALPGIPVAFDNRFEDGRLSGKSSLSYSLSQNAEVYASLGRGFKAGGFDGSTIFSAPEALPFRSENVWAYEGGVKFLPRGGPMQIEASGYYYDYTDLQANSTLEPTPGVFTNIRTNVGKATVYGGELSMTARPVTGLELRLGAALLHSKVTEIRSANAAEAARRLGNPLPNAPAMTLNGSVRYEIPLGERLTLTPLVTGRFVSKYFTELDNYHAIGDYFIGDARIELNVDRRWSIAGYVRNFSDTLYENGAAAASRTVFNVFRGAPRTYGLSLGARF